MLRLSKEHVKCAPSTARRIYLASPWFNDAQMQRMQDTLQVLREVWESQGENRRVYAPYYDLLCPPDADEETRDKVYEANVRESAYSDIIVAVTDEKDLGTIFELGYSACARDVSLVNPDSVEDVAGPVLVGVALTLGDRPFNLMLAKGLDVVCRTLGELRAYLEFGAIPDQSNLIE